MRIQEIVNKAIEGKKINSVVFVGCGGSFADLYPARYLMDHSSKHLRIGQYTSNEFVYDTPAYVGENSLVIACSHAGKTPETVEAARVGVKLGATAIAVAFEDNSPLVEAATNCVLYEWGIDRDYRNDKKVCILSIAAYVLAAVENWSGIKDFEQSVNMINDVVANAHKLMDQNGSAFVEQFKDEKYIYVVGSGPSYMSAYSYSICILMEMQWINSAAIHAGEYFHGPFEITDENTSFIILMGDGPTRTLDERALTFMKRFTKKIFVVDVKAMETKVIPESVRDFFSPVIIDSVMRSYSEKLATARNHPLTERRYMWKLEY